MAWIPIAMAAVSALSSAKGQQQQGEQAAAAAQYNADIANRNAAIAIQQGNFDADQQRRKAVLTMGQARALYGASGVTTEGSPLDVLASSAAQAEQDVQTIKYRARLRALGYEDSAGLDSMSADNATSAGFSGAIGSLLGSGASLYSNLPNSGSSGSTSTYTGAESAGTGSST